MVIKHSEPNQVKWVGVRPGIVGDQILVEIDSDAIVILYTVPADKILLLFSWAIGVGANTTNYGRLIIRDDEGVQKAVLAWVTSYTNDPGHNLNQSLTIPIELIEDWDIRLLTNTQNRGFIHGVLIDA